MLSFFMLGTTFALCFLMGLMAWYWVKQRSYWQDDEKTLIPLYVLLILSLLMGYKVYAYQEIAQTVYRTIVPNDEFQYLTEVSKGYQVLVKTETTVEPYTFRAYPLEILESVDSQAWLSCEERLNIWSGRVSCRNPRLILPSENYYLLNQHPFVAD